MGTFKRCFCLLFLVATACPVTSCSVKQYYVFAAPSIKEQTLPSRVSNHTLYVYLDGLELSISPARLVVTKEKIGIAPFPPLITTSDEQDPIRRPSPYPIEVRFYSWIQGYTFDPMQSQLTIADGTIIPPSSYLGPIHRTTSPGLDVALREHYPCASSDSDDTKPTTSKTSTAFPITAEPSAKEPIHAEGRLGRSGITCFWMLFDTEWLVNSTMQLSLKGISFSGDPINLPTINFTKGGAWVEGTVP